MTLSRKSTKTRVRFSQHFLSDSNILRRIGDNLRDVEGKNVTETGPGKGALTRVITEKKPKKLTLVEKDQSLIEDLKEEFEEADIQNMDILEKSIDSEIFVSSVPYSITRELLLHLCRSNKVNLSYLIIQKEVADKIAEEASVPVSVYVRTYFYVKKMFDIKKNSFIPPPKVNSSFVRLERIKEFEEKENDFWLFLTKTLSGKNKSAAVFGEEHKGKRIFELSAEELHRIYADKHIHTH